MKEKDKIVSFPHLGDYHIVIEYLLKKITNLKIMVAPPITKKTLELGSKYSPDFVCVPFKYNLGNYIEALENGANVLIQAGGGCRFGYYGEVQEQILRDLGYEFEFISLLSANNTNPFRLYKIFKKLNNKLSFFKFLYYFLLVLMMIIKMDKLDHYYRSNMGFELIDGTFDKTKKQFLIELQDIKNFRNLKMLYKKYKKLYKKIEINKPEDRIRIGIVGELYDLMEPFSNCLMEKELAKKGIEVTRYINVSFLLIYHKIIERYLMMRAGKYLKYRIGADGTSSVVRSKLLAKSGYDGIIHIKPFGCTPEVNAMPMLQNISNDYKIPIIYFSFDSQTSETGVKTRLEAFYDMIVMRKGAKK